MNEFGQALSEESQTRATRRLCTELVVVHKSDGSLIKGWVDLADDGALVVPASPLPHLLRVRGNEGVSEVVELSDTKAVFFVKRHEGDLDHDEVKFFSNVQAADVWVRIRFADGEVMEGETHNDMRILLDPGIWLRPFDGTANNKLIYVPKSSMLEFHIMGVAIPQLQEESPARLRTAADTPE